MTNETSTEGRLERNELCTCRTNYNGNLPHADPLCVQNQPTVEQATDGGPNGYYWKPRAEEAQAEITTLTGALTEARAALRECVAAYYGDDEKIREWQRRLEAAFEQAQSILKDAPKGEA